ncbi:unnamed protein product [Tenebrio molitor]|nr:unnamed protein product [Tenebrio molitor]
MKLGKGSKYPEEAIKSDLLWHVGFWLEENDLSFDFHLVECTNLCENHCGSLFMWPRFGTINENKPLMCGGYDTSTSRTDTASFSIAKICQGKSSMDFPWCAKNRNRRLVGLKFRQRERKQCLIDFLGVKVCGKALEETWCVHIRTVTITKEEYFKWYGKVTRTRPDLPAKSNPRGVVPSSYATAN